MDVLDDALRVIRSLNEAGVDYIVVGGVALNVHGLVRATEGLCGEYPAVRYGPPEGTLYLDIFTRLGEATTFADLEAEDKVLLGVRVRVATPRTLYRMKKDTVRPIDRSDALALRRAFGLDGEE